MKKTDKIINMKLPKQQETQSTIRFSAKLFRPEATKKIGSWTLLTLPKNASAKLPSRGMTMVEGTINSVPFRASLKPNGKGSHWLRVNKAMHDAAGADAGDTVTVEITRAAEEPETRVPMDLRKALAAAPLAQASWADITPMARRDWIFSICTAKQPETRRQRIETACSKLKAGERRPCCFNRNLCSQPYVSNNGLLLEQTQTTAVKAKPNHRSPLSSSPKSDRAAP